MLSIVIINFKNPPLLRLCLNSLKRTLSPDFDKEIIVVDINSSIETRNVAQEEFLGVQLVSFKNNIGFTKGVNEGIKKSKGDFVLILNPDTIPTPNAIEDMYKFMKNQPEIGMIGPQLLNFDGSIQDSCFKFPNPLTFIYRRTFLGKTPLGKKHLNYFLMRNNDRSKILETNWLSGSSTMMSREAINKVGLMDERFFLYMSDVDWPRRFWDNGYKVLYYPLARIYHYHLRESKGKYGILDIILKKESRWHLVDAVRYFRKYGLKNNKTSYGVN